MPIRIRLALFFAIGTAVLYTVFSLIAVHQLNVGLDSGVDSDLAQTATFMQRTLLIQAIDTQFGEEPPVEVPNGFRPPHSHGSPVFGQLLDRSNHVEGSVDLPSARSLLDLGQLQAAQSGPVHTDVNLPNKGGTVRVLAQPDPDIPGYVMVVGDPLGTGPDAQRGVRLTLIALFGPVVALAGLAGWFLSGAALRPVERMRAQADSISAHDDDTHLAVPQTRDELAGLATTMNDLLERLRIALRRQRAFVSDAGHELRTPLAILQGELELASKPGRSADELQHAVSEAATESQRLSRLAEDLLLLARGDEGHMPLRIERLSLNDTLQDAVSRAQIRAEERGVILAVDSPAGPSIVVDADAVRLQQAAGNLLENAIRHSPPSSTVRIGCTIATTTNDTAAFSTTALPAMATSPVFDPPVAESNGRDFAVVVVSDTGPGFSPSYLPFAFERFRRPDDSRSRDDGGAGLGLAIVKSIAESHGGKAGAENAEGGGARVWFSIPIHRS